MWLTMFMVQNMATMQILLPRRDVLYKSAGLVMNYISEYKPADSVISVTVAIPMNADMCYLIPLKSMKKIPQCKDMTHLDDQAENQLLETKDHNKTTRQHRKRALLQIIPLAFGIVSSIFSVINSIQTTNIQAQTASITSTLENMKNSFNLQNSQIMDLSKGAIELAEDLYHTQAALNKTIALVNGHSTELKQHRLAMNTLMSMISLVKKELTSFTQTMETHLLHESIDDILSNKLNLRFIHPYDLPRVIKTILKRANVKVDETDDKLPTIELVNRLLLKQEVTFVSTTNKNDQGIIGHLLFTSFIASTSEEQHPFTTYQLIPIPFNYGEYRAKLAQVPHMISISRKTMELIQWSKEESDNCRLKIAPSCRETPPIRTNWEETCLFQILTDSTLTLCRTEHEIEPIFVQKIGQQWAISTINETKCHKVTKNEPKQHLITTNNQITIPPIALITLDEATSLSCDHFYLPSSTNTTDEFISIIENKTIKNEVSRLVNLYQMVSNNTQWEKLPYIPSHLKHIIDHLITKSTTINKAIISWEHRWIPSTVMTLAIMMIILIVICAYLIRDLKKKTKKRIALPSI